MGNGTADAVSLGGEWGMGNVAERVLKQNICQRLIKNT